MNRLDTQIALIIMSVVIVTVALMIGAQATIISYVSRNLPPGVQARMEEIRQGVIQEMDEDGKGLPPVPDIEIARRLDRVSLAFLQTTLVSLIIGGLLASLLAWRLSRSIARPIERVSLAANEVAKGDFAARVILPDRQGMARNEVNELARDFNTMAQSLESYEHERRAMISDIAHELRTPLTALELRVEGMLSDLVPLDKEQLGKIKRQIDLLTRLVQDLRTLALADEGKLSLRKQATPLAVLVRECVFTYELLAKAKEITLKVETTDIVADVDPERLTQILGNLLDNALRVTPTGGKIRVSITEQDATIELAVEDSGPGIPVADLSQLFDRFTQGKDTKGTSGLGLAIVQTLTTLHGGSVRAFNKASGGARFVVTLPV